MSLKKILPCFFALLWSTGFIGAKFGLPYISPFTFLAIRFLLAIIFLSGIIIILKIKFPKFNRKYFHVFLSGLLIHITYLSGVFYALKIGLPAGDTAMIVGMQPILTIFIIHKSNLLKILLVSFIGFIGLLLTLYKGNMFGLQHIHWQMLIPAIFALFGITLGTIYQKQKCFEFNIIIIAFLQYLIVAPVFFILAYIFEKGQIIIWNINLVFALLWLSLVLSIGTILLMNWLYRHHSASKIANFFYLAPPLALIQAHLFFGEPINTFNFLGIILVIISLYFINRMLVK